MKINESKVKFSIFDRRSSLNDAIKPTKALMANQKINFYDSNSIARSCVTPSGKTKVIELISPLSTKKNTSRKIKIKLPSKLLFANSKIQESESKPIKSIILKNKVQKSPAPIPSQEISLNINNKLSKNHEESIKKKNYLNALIKDIVKRGVIKHRSARNTPVGSPRKSLESDSPAQFMPPRKSCVISRPFNIQNSGNDEIKIIDNVELAEKNVFGLRKNSRKEGKMVIQSKNVANLGTGSTAETGAGSFVKFLDLLTQERDQLICFNKTCIFLGGAIIKKTIIKIKKYHQQH